VQGFPPTDLRKELNTTNPEKVNGENVDVEEFSQNNQQKLVYSAEAVAKRLPTYTH